MDWSSLLYLVSWAHPDPTLSFQNSLEIKYAVKIVKIVIYITSKNKKFPKLLLMKFCQNSFRGKSLNSKNGIAR